VIAVDVEDLSDQLPDITIRLHDQHGGGADRRRDRRANGRRAFATHDT